jgi:O-antigen/teichoic acid export membrane protein
MIATLAASGLLLDNLLEGEVLLLVGLLIALPAYASTHLLRGTLSGSGRFRPYAWLLATEGLVRVGVVLVFLVIGFRVSGAYGLLIGLAPLAAVLVILSRQRGLLADGPPAKWSELSQALGWLLAGSVLAQGFVNAPVPIVQILSGPGEEAVAGVFQAGLIIARVPLFLFQAVQASLLPKLAGLAAAGKLTDFRTGLKRLLVVVGAIGVAATIGGFTIGPFVLRVAFGEQFAQLDHMDIGLLALASAAFMLAMSLAQALIAAGGHAKAAAGWLVAVIVLGVVIWLGDDLLLRVELGLVVGSIVATAVMGLLLRSHLGSHKAPPSAEPLIEAMSPTHEIIEP